ncbi:MAG: hypothetical protein HQ518_04825 [Rhodopirellula sp.]|nr:hypothetical protein [Rhodopirellula sp.]
MREKFLSRQRQPELTTTRRNFLRAWGVVGGVSLATSMLTGCRSTSRNADLPVVSLPGRHSVQADQLVLLSDFRIDYNHAVIADLKQLRGDVLRELELKPSEQPVVVYLFENEQLYYDYLKSTWPMLPYRRAYFFGNSYELAVYTSWGDKVQEDLRHEFTHGILHSTLRTVPLWLDEGIAEYFEEAGDKPGTVKRKAVERLSLALSNGWKPSMTRLEGLTEVADMGQSDYEESWAWIHFMLHGDPAVRQVLVNYLTDLRTIINPEPLSNRLDETMLTATDRFSSYVASLNTFGGPDGRSAAGRHPRGSQTADKSGSTANAAKPPTRSVLDVLRFKR